MLSTLYAVGSGVGNGASSLYEIANYGTAPKAVDIGNTGVLLTDIAINPKTNTSYEISFSDLYSINLSNGKVKEIGSLGDSGMNALTFSSSGTLYAMSSDTSYLYTVNVNTGHATPVFNTRYASAGDLAFNSGGALYVTTSNSDLVKINLSAKTATNVGSMGVPNLFGLVIDNSGNMYAAEGSNERPTAVMYKLNPTNGHATEIGTIAGASSLGLDGLSFNASSPSLSINNVTVQAVKGRAVSAVFTVSLSYSSAAPVTVHYATANGTAHSPTDYTATSGTLTFAPGQTSKQIAVAVKDNPADPPSAVETFTVDLSGAINATIGQAVGTGWIKEQAAPAQILYAVGSGVGNGSSSLYEIANYGSAPKAVDIGNTGVLLTDIAINPKTGAAYAISFSDLYSINLSTGKVTDIGSLGDYGMNALTFSSNGTLYAMSSDTSYLYTVNVNTGYATPLFDTGYISSGDIAISSSGAMYLTTANDDLVKINVSAETATDVGSMGVPNLFGLVIDASGNMYAAEGSNEGPAAVMYKINMATGAATEIGTIAGASNLGLDGLSF
jgi:hypothetical protein